MPQRDPVLKLILLWVTLLTTVVWLLVIRGLLSHESHEWDLGPLRGTDTNGDYWKLLVVLAVVLVIQLSGRRGPRPLFPFLLLPALIFSDAAAVYLAWTNPGALTGQDDAMSIAGALPYMLPVVFTLFVLLAIWWTVRRVRGRRFLHSDPPWVRRNAILLIIAALIVPVQFVAFRHGGESGDQIGVFATILQWFVLNAGLTAPSVRPVAPETPESFPPP